MPVFHIKDRNRPLPNGVSVVDASIGYRARPFASFTEQCEGVRQARLGNPGLCQRYRLPTDMPAIENFVSSFLGKVAYDNGWVDYYVVGGGNPADAVPFREQAGGARIARVAGAAAVSIEWIASGAEAVPPDQASRRAETCFKCPMNNTDGDWLSLFTVPVALAIREALTLRTGMKLSTPLDDKIGICDACDCVCKLKVHMKLDKINAMMDAETKSALHPDCWILKEST